MILTRRGFSLIEVSLSLAILAMVLSGILGIFGQGYLDLKKTKERAVAYSLAREALERYYNWASLPLTGATYSVNINGVNYNVNVAVVDGPVHPSELKQLNVLLTWPTGNFSLSTLKGIY